MLRCLSSPIGLLLLAMLPLQAAAHEERRFDARVLVQDEGLATPIFTSRVFPIFEKEIILSYSNPNEGSETEIHISRSPDSGFELASVAAPGEEVYEDTSRLPRTTYYFKLRAIKGELQSAFSEVRSFTTGSKFYPPSLTAVAKGPGTVALTFRDRSYNDLYYVLWRDGPGPDFNPTVTATDSGQVFIITDDFLEPGVTYYYRVDAYTKGPNMPRYIDIVNATVTTPEGPMIFAFTMIDADTDQEETGLYDGIELIPPDHPNIKAEASEGTQSVVFFLNGRRRVENQPPYAYFYDVKGDFRPGKLAPGDYELIATPYTGNNGTGVAGASLKINFKITVAPEDLAIKSFTLVDPATGQDIGELKNDDVVDNSVKPNIRINTGDKVGSVVMVLNGLKRIENQPPYSYFTDVDGIYRPGRLKDDWAYSLTAVTYTGNNGTGMKGDSIRIQFRTGSKNTIVNLRGEADATTVTLRWTPIADVQHYQIERIGGPPELGVAGSTIGKYGYFTDTGLPPNTTFSYAVMAVGTDFSMTAASDTITVTTTSQSTLRTHYNLLAIVFNPGGIMTHELQRIRSFLKYRVDFLKHASHYSVNLDIYQKDLIIIDAYPPLKENSNSIDYARLAAESYPELGNNNMVDLVERYDVDIVWVLGSPTGYDFGENILIGNEGLGQGTWPPVHIPSSRRFFVHSNLPDARAFDAAAHHVEGTMTSATEKSPDNWPRDKQYMVYTKDPDSYAVYPQNLNLFERFRLTDEWNGSAAYASKGNASVGSSHFIPGSIRSSPILDYTYYDYQAWMRYVDSYADDWLAYPNFSDTKRKINGYEHGAFNFYFENTLNSEFRTGTASFHYWWFNHIPHNPGVTDGKLNNWWPYIYDVNRFDGSPIDYTVSGFPEIPKAYGPTNDELGTEENFPEWWQYWHTANNYGQRADITTVSRAQDPTLVRSGEFSVQVSVEVQSFAIDGTSELIYPTFKNAHWNFSNADSVTISMKFPSLDLVRGTNPVIRLCKNGNNKIEFVPKTGNGYANLFQNNSLRDNFNWYTFHIPTSGNNDWERNVIGYIDPDLSEAEKEQARQSIIDEVLKDVNYFEISIQGDGGSGDFMTVYIDNLKVHFKEELPGISNAEPLSDDAVSVSVYPIPATHELNLDVQAEHNGNVLIVVKNLEGNPVYSSVNSIHELNNYAINTSAFPPGIYFLHLMSKRGTDLKVVKFFKK